MASNQSLEIIVEYCCKSNHYLLSASGHLPALPIRIHLAFYAIAYIEAWKIQDFNGVWTQDLATPVRRSNQLSAFIAQLVMHRSFPKPPIPPPPRVNTGHLTFVKNFG